MWSCEGRKAISMPGQKGYGLVRAERPYLCQGIEDLVRFVCRKGISVREKEI